MGKLFIAVFPVCSLVSYTKEVFNRYLLKINGKIRDSVKWGKERKKDQIGEYDLN